MSGNDPINNPEGTGEQLRDARLVRALEHAPDVQEAAQPAAALRESILRAAHEAVTAAPAAPISPTAPVAPWRSRWTAWLRGDSSSGRMPWNAAFATVLLAGFITLLWRDEPIPPAQVDGPVPAVQQEAAAPPPLPMPPAAAPQAPVEVPAHNREKEAKKPAPPPVRPRPAAPAEAAKDMAAGAPPVAHEPAVAAAPTVSSLPPPLSPPPPPAPAAPAAAPARAEVQTPVDAGMAAADSAAAAAAKAKQQERAGPSTALSAARRAAVGTPALPADWTHVRRADAAVASDGVPHAAAGELPRLLATLKSGSEADAALTQWGTDGLNSTPVARVALLRGGSVLGVLELSGQRWRFVPEPGSGLTAHQGVLPDAEARELLAALQRVAP